MSLTNILGVIRELRDTGPMSVQEMADTMEVSESTAWHWAALLKAEGVVRHCGLRDGRVMLYELAPKDYPRGKPYVRKQPRSSKNATG